jgi:hypothetical protein
MLPFESQCFFPQPSPPSLAPLFSERAISFIGACIGLKVTGER